MSFHLYIATKTDKITIETDSETDSETLQQVKEIIKQDKFCIQSDLYDEVRYDNSAMNFWLNKKCTYTAERSEADNRIKTTYGIPRKTLGYGSYGIVYKYRDPSNKFWAIKIPKVFHNKELFDELNSSECIKELVDDKEMLSKFGLVLECLWPENKTPSLVMNYYCHTFEYKIGKKYQNGWDHFNRDKKEQALNDMLMISYEIKALHDAGIAHRDLKPENIMIDEDANPILVDFGTTTPNAYRANSLVGSPMYLDYEIQNGNGLGITSDIFSLCIVFARIHLGHDATSNIEEMQTNGNYDAAVASKGVKMYAPSFRHLKVSKDFKWTSNMMKITNSNETSENRWEINRVIQELQDMLVKNQEAKEREEKEKIDKINQETLLKKDQNIDILKLI